MVWTLVEPGVAIIASSLATIRPLLRAWKVRGFESTRGHYGTGLSATGRSVATRSRPMDAANTGLNDVVLENVEPKLGPRPRIIATEAGITFEQHNKDLPSLPLTPTTAKSEVYIIEGNKLSPKGRWSDNQSLNSPNESFEQLHDLEAQSQDTRGFGLGDGGR